MKFDCLKVEIQKQTSINRKKRKEKKKKMPKSDPFSPKAIANRIKAKGLQKLKWYCQMCERQMRDENGWKCHCESESHLRQMSLFTTTPSRFTNDFSHQFEQGFMDLVRRIYRSKRVLANRVYNEYIQDKVECFFLFVFF